MVTGRLYDPHAQADALGVEITYDARLPRKGLCRLDHRLIVLRSDLSRIAERCTLAHELAHVVAGDTPTPFGFLHARQESRADRTAASWLIDPLEYAAAEALRGPHDGAIADDLSVTLHLLGAWQRSQRVDVRALTH